MTNLIHKFNLIVSNFNTIFFISNIYHFLFIIYICFQSNISWRRLFMTYFTVFLIKKELGIPLRGIFYHVNQISHTSFQREHFHLLFMNIFAFWKYFRLWTCFIKRLIFLKSFYVSIWIVLIRRALDLNFFSDQKANEIT